MSATLMVCPRCGPSVNARNTADVVFHPTEPWRCRHCDSDLVRLQDYKAPPRERVVRAAHSKKKRSSLSPSQRTRIMQRDGFRCRRCGAGPDDERLVIDHVTPVSMGGTSHDQNLQTLCTPCNQGKADRLPHPHDLRGLL